MENIGKFLAVAESLGVAKMDLFQTVDLYEAQNIPGVIYFSLYESFFILQNIHNFVPKFAIALQSSKVYIAIHKHDM